MAGQIDIIVAKKAIEELNKMNAGLDKTLKLMIKISQEARKFTPFSKAGTPKGLEAQLKKNAAAQKKVKDGVEKTRLAEIRLQQQREKAFDRFNRGIERQRKARLRETDAIERNKRALDRQRQAALRSNTVFGRLNRTFGRFALALGLTSGIFLFIRALGNAIRSVVQFNKQVAILASVLQKTRKEIRPLTENAKELGAITAKTSNEIVKLQVAYARLGFTQSEILDLTEATIEGSISLNAQLDETATLTGAVVNSMDALSTTDAPKIMDIMALSTAKSALNFEKLAKGLPIVLGAANALEVPFTKVVAILGKLASAGIETSTAGTSLRNIFIESAKKGIDFEKALEKVRVSQNKLTTANEIFGKRAAVSALVIANNVKGIKEFDEALQNAGGTAKTMADTQLDTLEGEMTLMTSAWDGFVKSIEDGEGTIATSIRGIIGSITDLLNALIGINELTEILSGEDLSEGLLGIPFLSLIRNSAKASAQLQVLNDDYKELRTSGVEDLADAYVFYEDMLIRTTDPVFVKLIDFQIERIIKLTIERRKLNREAEFTADLLFEEKEKIIDVLIEIDKELDVRELQKKSLKELQTLLNKYNEELNDSTKILKGSIKFLEEIIKKNRELIRTTDDDTYRKKLIQQNALLAQQIKLLLKIPAAINAISVGAALQVGGTTPEGAEGEVLDLPFKFQDFSTTVLEDIIDFVDEYGEQISEAIDITNAFFDNRLERIQQDIDANNEFFANQIALAEGNEAEQVRLEAERQKRDAELKKKQSEEARKQFIIKQGVAIATIGINTAVAISEASPNVLKIIAAALLGATQLATVISTPVPKFAEGTESAPKGLAVVGDAGVHEYIETPQGIFKTPDTDTLVSFKGREKIHKDLDSLAISKGYDLEAINKAAVMTSIFNDGVKLNSIQLANVFNDTLKKFNSKIESKIERGIKRGFKGVSIHNNTNFDHSIYKSEVL